MRFTVDNAKQHCFNFGRQLIKRDIIKSLMDNECFFFPLAYFHWTEKTNESSLPNCKRNNIFQCNLCRSKISSIKKCSWLERSQRWKSLHEFNATLIPCCLKLHPLTRDIAGNRKFECSEGCFFSKTIMCKTKVKDFRYKWNTIAI